jgi:hypothetical protein
LVLGVVNAEGDPEIAHVVFETLSPAESAGLTEQEVIAPPAFEGMPVVTELA